MWDIIAWHLHYFDADGRQDTSEENVVENIEVGSSALGHPDMVHMGWTFQNDFSLRHLARAGVRVDYSPVPCMRFRGHRGDDAYDWSRFAYRPQFWHGVRMIPAFSAFDPVLSPALRAKLLRDSAPTIARILRSPVLPRAPQGDGTYYTTPRWADWRRYRRQGATPSEALLRVRKELL